MFDLDPRDYDSRDNERRGNAPSRGARGNSNDRQRDDNGNQHRRGRATAMTMTRGNLDAVQATIGKARTRTSAIVIAIPAATSVNGTAGNAIEMREIRSVGMSGCRADQGESSFEIATVSTRYEARSRGLWQR
jgi:hypothetical protein